MTPFELSLERELNVEWQRFANEWLFPWHNINIEGRAVEVEDFRGGKFHVGGIVFQGQIQELYWQAIARYLSGKVDETFRKWDVETRGYPTDVRRASMAGVENLLRHFVAKIVEHSTDTDRRLRGRGFPENVPKYNSTGCHSGANAQILRLGEAHRSLLDSAGEKVPAKPERLPILKQIEELYAGHRGLIWAVGAVGSGCLALWKFFVG